MSFSNKYESTDSKYLKGLIKYSYILFICSITISISACGGNNEEAPANTSEQEVAETAAPESTTATSNDITSEIQKNREKWLAHDISDYEIEMQKICYCIPEVVRMMVFEVSGDNVETVRYADTGEDVDPQHYGDFNTIEGMFSFVEAALGKNPADLSIAYDEKYGYIKELSIDFKENIADDEISIIASNMRPR
ncbi:MAG: DUF6174 domain-containing protein [Gammaproteobacteria bacterium]